MKATNLTILAIVLSLAGHARANWVTDGDNMYADITGNVGIGTTNPDNKLTVEGRIGADVSYFLMPGTPVICFPGRSGTISGHNMVQELFPVVTPFPDNPTIVDPLFYIRKTREAYGFLGGSLSECGLSPLTDVTYGIGAYGEVTTGTGMGVYGHATDANDVENYGGYFVADGKRGYGVYGEASNSDEVVSWNTKSYGGYFVAYGQRGIGIYAQGGPEGSAAKFEGSLVVNGSIYQGGTLLHADYVFKSDYELESIEEHSQFMWQNGHLKAIPKARADNNGQEIVEVGAHQRGTVEELEKAHIYIEQLNNRINALEEKLAKLEAVQIPTQNE